MDVKSNWRENSSEGGDVYVLVFFSCVNTVNNDTWKMFGTNLLLREHSSPFALDLSMNARELYFK